MALSVFMKKRYFKEKRYLGVNLHTEKLLPENYSLNVTFGSNQPNQTLIKHLFIKLHYLWLSSSSQNIKLNSYISLQECVVPVKTHVLLPLFIICDVKTSDFHTEKVKASVLLRHSHKSPPHHGASLLLGC